MVLENIKVSEYQDITYKGNSEDELNLFLLRTDSVVANISKTIEFYTGLSYDRIKNDSRKRELVEARQITMYFLRKKTKFSYATIGMYFNRDHATAIHSEKTITNLIKSDRKLLELVSKIDEKLVRKSNKLDKSKIDIFIELLDELNLSEEERAERFTKYIRCE